MRAILSVGLLLALMLRPMDIVAQTTVYQTEPEIPPPSSTLQHTPKGKKKHSSKDASAHCASPKCANAPWKDVIKGPSKKNDVLKKIEPIGQP